MIAVCTTASQVLSTCSDWDGGILVSGYRFADMMYEDLRECLPSTVEMLMLSSPAHFDGSGPEGIVYLAMPLKVQELVGTLQMMIHAQARRGLRERSKGRSQKDQALIAQAKALLMERNSMTEAEAHRYIQKCSMDSGTNMAETAQMVMSLM